MERAMGIEPTSEAWKLVLGKHKRMNWRQFSVLEILKWILIGAALQPTSEPTEPTGINGTHGLNWKVRQKRSS
jgi:hypothetical protein